MNNSLKEKSDRSIFKHKAVKITAIVLAVLFVLAGSGIIAIYAFLGRINHATAEQDSEFIDPGVELVEEAEAIPAGYEVVDENEFEIETVEESVPVITDKKITNVLLIGSDSRGDGAKGRSDTMIIFSIDKRNGKLKMTSLLRDLYVPIPGRKDNRINAAYAYGGTSLLINTIETNFKIKIDKYVRVSFKDFVKIIDHMGGVSVNLTEKEAAIVGGSAGTRLLNGTEALRYSRIRKIDSDFGRTNRQRTVIKALIGKMKKMSITELSSLMYDIMPYITTDYSSTELLALISQANTLKQYPLSELHIPESGKYRGVYIGGKAVLSTNLNDAAKSIQKFIYEK
ncbi:MAG: LCP family protein [Clostridia bacterium]|nr:LCP family protein [Clostridia bacterium]